MLNIAWTCITKLTLSLPQQLLQRPGAAPAESESACAGFSQKRKLPSSGSDAPGWLHAGQSHVQQALLLLTSNIKHDFKRFSATPDDNNLKVLPSGR